MAGDQVMGEGEVAEAEALGVDGDDGERDGRAVTEGEFQGAAGLQVELVGGEFADGGGVLGELPQGTGGDVRVPGAGEAPGRDPLGRVLVQAHTDGRTDHFGDGVVGHTQLPRGLGRDAGALGGHHPVGADALAGLGAGRVAQGRLDEENGAGHADEEGERSDDGGHPGCMAAKIGARQPHCWDRSARAGLRVQPRPP